MQDRPTLFLEVIQRYNHFVSGPEDNLRAREMGFTGLRSYFSTFKSSQCEHYKSRPVGKGQ